VRPICKFIPAVQRNLL